METKLIALQIELTNACKLACAECPRYLMSRPVGVMKLDLVKTLISDGVSYRPDMGFNVNGLGEPLLYPHFAEMVNFMGQNNVKHMELFTSLIAPPRLMSAAFDSMHHNRNVGVQLAITKHLYDGKGKKQIDDSMFDSHLEHALKLPDHVDKHMGCVLTKYHTDEDVEEFKAKYSKFFPPTHFHIIKSLNPWFNLVADMAHPVYGSAGVSMDRHVCDYPFILLHVGWNGDAIVCCTDDVDGDAVLGRLEKPGDLIKVWHGEKYEEMRRKHNAYVIDMKPCDKCERTAWARK